MHMNGNPALEAMLKKAAQELGTTPEALQHAAQSGDLSAALKDQGDISQLQQILCDPQAAQDLLNSPQAKRLMELFQSGNQ